MNNVKGSFLFKALVHIVLFLSGITILIGGYYIVTFLDSYSSKTTTFTETSEFQTKYLKYVERVAMYVDYREKGFTGSVGYDSSSPDISTLFKQADEKYDTSNLTSQQKDFSYYNAILNNANSNFLYYVKNLKTGAIYYSSSLEDMVGEQPSDEVSLETMNAYLENIQLNPAYLIINTMTERYFTNVNRNYQILNDDNLRWVIEYMKNSTIKQSGNSNGDYILCTSIVDGFPNHSDEFGVMNEHFKDLYYNYKSSLYPFVFALVVFLISFVLVISFSGHKKGIGGITTNGFDHWYTEISLGLVLIGILGLYEFVIKLSSILLGDFDLKIFYILILAYTILYPFCMYGFLSFIRRCKANILFRNSLFNTLYHRLCLFIIDFFAQRNFTYRVAFLLILFGGIQTLAFYSYFVVDIINNISVFMIIIVLDYIFLGYVMFKAAIDYNILSDETRKLTEGNLTHKIPVSTMCAPARILGDYINNIGNGLSAAVDEKLKSEHLKTELITNVSHDIKTPLTSIINYVDLLKKENLENKTAVGYLEILSAKSWRLKTLIEDLVEASKASSGAITMNLECLNLVELIRQSVGEFQDRFISHNLDMIITIAEEPIYIMADGRSTYRIIENIFSNVNKYTLSGTRVYVDITTESETVSVSVKNISANKLNISADELMERFVRGDLARNTEGSGLGLSIAKSLADLQDATFDIILDGDLFKAVLRFHRIEQSLQDNNLSN